MSHTWGVIPVAKDAEPALVVGSIDSMLSLPGDPCKGIGLSNTTHGDLLDILSFLDMLFGWQDITIDGVRGDIYYVSPNDLESIIPGYLGEDYVKEWLTMLVKQARENDQERIYIL